MWCGRAWGWCYKRLREVRHSKRWTALFGVAELGGAAINACVRCATRNAGLLCVVWQSLGVMLKTPA